MTNSQKESRKFPANILDETEREPCIPDVDTELVTPRIQPPEILTTEHSYTVVRLSQLTHQKSSDISILDSFSVYKLSFYLSKFITSYLYSNSNLVFKIYFSLLPLDI